MEKQKTIQKMGGSILSAFSLICGFIALNVVLFAAPVTYRAESTTAPMAVYMTMMLLCGILLLLKVIIYTRQVYKTKNKGIQSALFAFEILAIVLSIVSAFSVFMHDNNYNAVVFYTGVHISVATFTSLSIAVTLPICLINFVNGFVPISTTNKRAGGLVFTMLSFIFIFQLFAISMMNPDANVEARWLFYVVICICGILPFLFQLLKTTIYTRTMIKTQKTNINKTILAFEIIALVIYLAVIIILIVALATTSKELVMERRAATSLVAAAYTSIPFALSMPSTILNTIVELR